jgi:multiple sugar transport system substrate-binding protein
MGAAALLAACGSGDTASTPAGAPGGAPTAVPTTPPAATPTATKAATGVPGDGKIHIVNSGATLPTEKVTFRWVDSGDQKAVFWKQYFPLYEKAHPNVTVQYDPLPWNEIQKVVPLGVQNGNAHDVFQVPPNIPGAQAVAEGWVAPLDDIIPNFAEWKRAFPPGAFVNGITTFNGKTYTIPLTSNKRYGTLLLYNLDYLQRAGYDPATKPLTWDEFRAAAKKVTEQGKGQYYGLIEGGNQTGRWQAIVAGLAEMAGAAGGELNWKTGPTTTPATSSWGRSTCCSP